MPDPLEVSGFAEFERDLEKLQRALENAKRTVPRVMGQTITQALLILQGEAAIYPAAVPDSAYVRTGTLGRRWTTATRVLGASAGGWIAGTVGNNTWYGPFVQDEEEQTTAHRAHGWKTIQQVAREQTATIDRLLSQAGVQIGEAIIEEAGG